MHSIDQILSFSSNPWMMTSGKKNSARVHENIHGICHCKNIECPNVSLFHIIALMMNLFIWKLHVSSMGGTRGVIRIVHSKHILPYQHA